jgi:hypothetical protein
MNMRNKKCNKNIEKFAYTMREFPKEYPEEIINALSLISGDINNIQIMGSFRQKSLWFSGDIDGFEIIPLEKQAQLIKNIVYKIVSSPIYGSKLILGDIKCGTNKYRDLLKYIGEIKNGVIYNYDLKTMKMIVKDTVVPEIQNAPQNINYNEWLNLYKFVNSFVAVRWTYTEILKGTTKDGYLLEPSIHNSIVTKIDMFYNYYGKYVEITNIIFPEMKQMDFFINQMRIGLSTNLINNNILKALKNMYSIARLIKDCNTLEKIAPILISPTNLLNSCNTDIKIIEDLINFGFDIHYNKLALDTHINTIILKLGGYYLGDLDLSLFNKIKNIENLRDKDNILKEVDEISKIISSIVNKHTNEYIKSNNISFSKYII